MRQIQAKSNSTSMLLRWSWLAAVIWCSTSLLSPLQAQMVPAGEQPAAAVEVPENITPQQVRDLVARLSDAEVRELIITQLDKQATATAEDTDPAVYIGQLRSGITIAMGALTRMFSSGDRIHQIPASIWQQLTDSGRISGWYLLFQLIGLLLAGGACELLAGRFINKATSKPGSATSTKKRFDLACFGLMTGVLRIAVFTVGAAVFLEITSRQMPVAQAFWLEVLWCIVLIRLVLVAVRQLATSDEADSALLPTSEKAVQQMVAWSVLLSGSLVLPRPLIAIATDSGADSDSALLLGVIFGAVFVGLIMVLVIRLRDYGASLILGDGENTGSIRQMLARTWWMLAIAYLLVIWLLSIGKRAATGESSLVPGLGSLSLLALLPFIDQGVKSLITWYFSEKKTDDDTADATETDPVDNAEQVAENLDVNMAEIMIEPALEEVVAPERQSEAPVYIAIALRYARVFVVMIVLTIFVRLWDIDLHAISAQLIGPLFASALFNISITVLLTWALWGMIRISIERKLSEGKGSAEEGESEAGGLGGTRVETVLPLIRSSIKITLVVMAVLISLSSLGVNIGPLIAGAGVVGIAIGFGAQTLVRDIVSGFFYLLDDAFRIGEYVVIDQIRGTVEKISVRSFQLRHHNGPVHTIPYGEIRTLTNWSRDWSIMKFELRVPFETDIDMVRKMIKQIGLDMADDPAFGPTILSPLKSQGVNRIDDSALIIRCKFTAIPGQQFLIRREAFTRIQRVFEANGIQFAPRRVLVEATTPEEAVKAAAGALDQEIPADPSKPPPM
jgi:small-conductance mechanosensitive channel